jgi:hypothetical protein
MPEPWEQLRGEPKESFNRFLIYRNLGPARSLNLAYRYYLQSLPLDPSQPAKVAKGSKRQQAPGNWCSDSERYKWTKRAAAWDTDQLLKVGSDIAPFWAQVLRDVVKKAARALLSPNFKPRQWRDVLLVLDKVSPYLNPEVFKEIQAASGAGTSPATSAARVARSTIANPEPPTPRNDPQPQRELTNEDVE